MVFAIQVLPPCSRDFLTDGIKRTPEWLALDDVTIDQLHADLSAVFSKLPLSKSTSESQTEDDLIWPVLSRIGWVDSLRQQNLAVNLSKLVFEDVFPKLVRAVAHAAPSAALPDVRDASLERFPLDMGHYAYPAC